MDYSKLLSKLTSDLGEKGVGALSDVLEKEEAKADEPWKKALIGLTAEGLRQFGPDGVQKVSEAVERLLDKRKKKGLKISDLTSDLEVASTLLAELQNAEAAKKKKVRDFLRLLGQVLGQVTKGFIKGLL